MEENGCSVGNFISSNDSICREERQYAVFLYAILRNCKNSDKRKNDDVKGIFDACSIPPEANIKHVFYEPTFMRDFFERDKENGFNNKLLQYVYKDCPNIKSLMPDIEKCNFNLGRWLSKLSKEELEKLNPYINSKIKEIIQNKNKKKKEEPEPAEKMIQHMMNIKPDIAVIYEAGKGDELLFLECKFESPEKGNQRAIHWLVADFLCNHYLEGIEMADAMKEENQKEEREKKKSCLVKFVRNERKKKNEIEIGKLIELSDKIFSSQK